MSKFHPDTLNAIVHYLYSNYFDDMERFAGIKMIGAMIAFSEPKDVPSMIDKIAIFNSFEKSYPPEGPDRETLIKSVSKILSEQ